MLTSPNPKRSSLSLESTPLKSKMEVFDVIFGSYGDKIEPRKGAIFVPLIIFLKHDFIQSPSCFFDLEKMTKLLYFSLLFVPIGGAMKDYLNDCQGQNRATHPPLIFVPLINFLKILEKVSWNQCLLTMNFGNKH